MRRLRVLGGFGMMMFVVVVGLQLWLPGSIQNLVVQLLGSPYNLTQVNPNTFVYHSYGVEEVYGWEEAEWMVAYFRELANWMGFDGERVLALEFLSSEEFVPLRADERVEGYFEPDMGVVEFEDRAAVVFDEVVGLYDSWRFAGMVLVEVDPTNLVSPEQVTAHELAHLFLYAVHGPACPEAAGFDPGVSPVQDACYWLGVVDRVMADKCGDDWLCQNMREFMEEWGR